MKIAQLGDLRGIDWRASSHVVESMLDRRIAKEQHDNPRRTRLGKAIFDETSLRSEI